MSVYKEDAKLLQTIEAAQSNVSVSGSLRIRVFDLDKLTPVQKPLVDQLREWCEKNKEDAEIKTVKGAWYFDTKLDEGEYGWDVSIKYEGRLLFLTVNFFRNYEA